MIVLRPGIVTGREIDRSDGEAGACFDGRVQTSNADQAVVSPSHQKQTGKIELDNKLIYCCLAFDLPLLSSSCFTCVFLLLPAA